MQKSLSMDNRIKIHDKYFVPYIPNEKLIKAIDNVAAKLNADFEGKDEYPLILPVLSGSIIFAGHLLPRLHFNSELSAIRVSSYEGTRSTGNIKEILGLTTDVQGRTV